MEYFAITCILIWSSEVCSFFPRTFSLRLFTAEVSAESYVGAELASVTAATSLSRFHLATPSSKKA